MLLMRRPLRFALLLALISAIGAGCAPWHDFFQRDQPDEALIAQTLAAPGPERTDVAVVLGCPADPDGGLSPCLQCRVQAAVRSYRAGRVGALLFSGGAAHNRHVEAEVMAEAALRAGVPAARILVEGRSLTTWQNLRYAGRLMRGRALRTALVISAAAHLPRARRFTEYYGIPARYLACDRPEDRPAAPAEAPAGAR
jgi:uncharacterized SAM-binding protein YcdF (DUF218 family)